MDELIRMIDRTDRVVNFYVKCPEGKRGRPMNAGRAAAMSKIDSSSVCVKESKEGGRTTFHGMGNKSVHKQVSQEIKTKQKEANKGKDKASLRELKYTNRRTNREAAQDYKARIKEPEYKKAITEAQKQIEEKEAKPKQAEAEELVKGRMTRDSQSAKPLGRFLKNPRTTKKGKMNELAERVKQTKATGSGMNAMAEELSGLKLKVLVNLAGALGVNTRNAHTQKDLVATILDPPKGSNERPTVKPNNTWGTIKYPYASEPEQSRQENINKSSVGYPKHAEGSQMIGRSDIGKLVEKIKNFNSSGSGMNTIAEEIGDLRRSDLLNLAGRLGVKTKDAYSHEDLMHLIVDETLRAKARSRAI